ncbi:MAG: L-ribulose-5-phosphate 4-epimerase [Ignavibacteriaceae bacterium]|jgi:L-ribulose-5-phosphate 4-epimerase
MLETLKEKVLKANLALVEYGLVTLTWGNASGIDRKEGLVVIKPGGVEYNKMKAGDMVVVDLKGNVVEGQNRPSSDTPTHVELYKAFTSIGGITHSHSEYATIFAQACIGIPCLGTTHADHFYGTVPVTRFLTKDEVNSNYELNTGKVIIERFRDLDPGAIPGVLIAGHAPFTWGKDPDDSVKNNLALERIAKMALFSLQLKPNLSDLPEYILKKHYLRKHGPNAYYGQPK